MIADAPHPPPPACPNTYTAAMVNRAVDAAFRGTRHVSAVDVRHLHRFIRCARDPREQAGERARWVRARRAWWHRRLGPPWQGPVSASWFDDAGSTACGTHVVNGFASRWGACGMKLQMRGPSGAVITATREDYGPASWTGREFDLSPSLKASLGCGDTCAVFWR